MKEKPNKKRPLPKRRQASAASRLRPFWLLFVPVLVLGAAGIGFAVFWPGFYPKRVDVSGNRIVARTEVVDKAGVLPNVNMWLQNTHKIAQKVEAIPYVATASVHRLPPDTISIGITERVPFAVARSGTRAALIDKDLRVLEAAPAATPELPVFAMRPGRTFAPGDFLSDAAATAMMSDYQALVTAHVVPVRLSLDRFGELEVTLRDGVKILLGDDGDLSKKIALIDPILSQVVRKNRGVKAIDLRAPGTPVVVYK